MPKQIRRAAVNSMDFELERLADDVNSGYVKSAEIRLDPAHNFKQEHIDVHIIYNDREATKLVGLSGVEKLKQDCPWVIPGSTIKL